MNRQTDSLYPQNTQYSTKTLKNKILPVMIKFYIISSCGLKSTLQRSEYFFLGYFCKSVPNPKAFWRPRKRWHLQKDTVNWKPSSHPWPVGCSSLAPAVHAVTTTHYSWYEVQWLELTSTAPSHGLKHGALTAKAASNRYGSPQAEGAAWTRSP